MDTAMKNLLARVSGALALAVLFMHVGQHLVVVWPDASPPTGAWVVVALFLVLAVAGAWAQARLNVKRAALWTACVVSGLLPVGAFAAHAIAPEVEAGGGYAAVLWLNLVFGALTLVFTGWLLATGKKQDVQAR